MWWRALLLLAVLLVGGPALAAPSSSSEVWKEAIKGAVQGMTLEEIIEWSDAQFRRAATVGRYVRWGGAITLGATLVFTALDWYFSALGRRTGTSLDQWWEKAGQPAYFVVGVCRSGVSGIPGYVHVHVKTWVPDGWLGVDNYYFYGGCDPDTVVSYLRRVAGDWYAMRPEVGPPSQWVPFAPSSEYCRVTADDLIAEVRLCAGLASPARAERSDLSTWLQQHPDAAQAVKQVVVEYVDAHPIGSPRAPYPGVELDPVPNPNEWTDNPFTRPDIDTDGDGYPDSVEWHEANRRGVPWPDVINNPDVYPDPKADPDGDGYTTGEEISLGTDPYDPASRPARRAPGPRTDTDGDGWPDTDEIDQGTDPRDPNSKPVGTPPLQDTDGDGVPDVEEIKKGTDPTNPQDKPEQKEEEWPGGPPPKELKPVELPEVSAEEKKELPENLVQRLGQEWSEQVTNRIEERLNQLREIASTRFPFALVSSLDVNIQQGSASCAWEVPIGQFVGRVDLCSTPFWQAAALFRPVLEGLLWLSVVLAIVRRGLDVQQ